MNVLQQIFTDYYEEIEYILHPRKTEMENIDKMIHCGDPSFGGAMYGCPHCGKLKFVPFRCHSRFCPTCGNKYTMDRTTSMSFKLVNVTHRHCVFTIDENLREFFLKDRSLLDCLFHSVNSVITRMFFKMNKSKNFTPGFIMVLHKLVDCLEKCLIYGHIRRFANWFYYSFTTFNGLSLDMQKAPAGCRIDRYTTLRGTSKRKNKITPPIRRRFSLLHWRTGTLLFYALMLRSKGKWSLDLCGS